MRSSRLSCSLLLSILLIGVASSASADPPRGPLKTSPRIGGREVKELVLTAPVQMGEPLPPSLPTVRTYTISPNRFAPVSEDVNAVYYQADDTFAEGNHDTGGLRVSKAYPDQVFAYWGNARYPNIKLVCYDHFAPADVRKIHVRFAGSHATHASTPHK